MVGFLVKGLFGVLLLISVCLTRHHKKDITKKLHPMHVWSLFLDRVYYFFPERIVIDGVDEASKSARVLFPGRYHDICCNDSLLNLNFPVATEYRIKQIYANNSEITIGKGPFFDCKKPVIKIDSVILSENSKLNIGQDLEVVIDKQQISGGSRIAGTFFNR